jgi:hypothetical protein
VYALKIQRMDRSPDPVTGNFWSTHQEKTRKKKKKKKKSTKSTKRKTKKKKTKTKK